MKFKLYPFLRYRVKKLLKIIEKQEHAANLRAYLQSDKKPWSRGYDEYKWQFIQRQFQDANLAQTFASQSPLPPNYGTALDERVVEYPWAISQINPDPGLKLLDAGSTLNFETIINHPKLHNKDITIANLNPERNCFWSKGVSYVFCDIRSLPFKDEIFDIITCLSTLEHIGMDNRLYTGKTKRENAPAADFAKAVIELKRVLKPNGQLLITVPFGKAEDHGFFRQFNQTMLDELLQIFAGTPVNLSFYKYSADGWQISDAENCRNAEYFDIRQNGSTNPDRAAAARAVACINLNK